MDHNVHLWFFFFFVKLSIHMSLSMYIYVPIHRSIYSNMLSLISCGFVFVYTTLSALRLRALVVIALLLGIQLHVSWLLRSLGLCLYYESNKNSKDDTCVSFNSKSSETHRNAKEIALLMCYARSSSGKAQPYLPT